MTCANTTAPSLLDWSNITASSDNRAISRGISFAIGTPPQALSLRPSINDNNTFVFNVADCVSASTDTCIRKQKAVSLTLSSDRLISRLQEQHGTVYKVPNSAQVPNLSSTMI